MAIIKKDGYEFCFDSSVCETCKGRCCRGEPGNIWVTEKEIKGLQDHLRIDREKLVKRYLRKLKYKYSIDEYKATNGYDCIFFCTEKMQCSVYEARPEQCRTFPFWDYFKSHITELLDECPGIIVPKI